MGCCCMKMNDELIAWRPWMRYEWVKSSTES